MITENSVLNNRYHLEKRVGVGGFAQVFLATDQVLKRQVAVKVLNSSLVEEEGFLTRFQEEAQRVASLNHPNILTVHDYGLTEDEIVYLVMTYIDGGTIHDKLRKEKKLSLIQADQYLQQVAAAIDYAHRRNIIHRDIKPQNMLLQSEDDRLVLADFGLAKVLNSNSAQHSTGILGTLSYMSPEQLRGMVGKPTDIYALGCVLFQILVGQPPFVGPTEQVVTSHLFEPIPSIVERSKGQLNPALQEVMDKALAKDPEARYQTAGELYRAFHTIVRDTAHTADFSSVVVEVAEPTKQLKDTVTAVTGSHLEQQTGPKALNTPVTPIPVQPNPPAPSAPVEAEAIPPKKSRVPLFAGLAGLLALIVIGIVIAIAAGSPAPKAAPTATVQAVVVPTATTAAVATPTVAPTTVAVIATATSLPATPTVALPTATLVVTTAAVIQPTATIAPPTVTPTPTVPFGTQITTLSGHSSAVVAVAVSADGTTLASASSDKTIKLWDIARRRVYAPLAVQNETTNTLLFSPDGKSFISAGDNGSVKLWDVATRKETATFNGHFGNVYAVAFSPDGKTLATGGDDRTVKLWDVATHAQIASFTADRDRVYAVAFSPDGKTLATGGGEFIAKLWEVATRTQIATLSGHRGYIRAVAFSLDGLSLATGSNDNSVILWDTDNFTQIATLTGHNSLVSSVKFSPDGKTLATGGGDSVRIWDAATRKQLTSLSLPFSFILPLSFGPDSHLLATGGDDSIVRLWSV